MPGGPSGGAVVSAIVKSLASTKISTACTPWSTVSARFHVRSPAARSSVSSMVPVAAMGRRSYGVVGRQPRPRINRCPRPGQNTVPIRVGVRLQLGHDGRPADLLQSARRGLHREPVGALRRVATPRTGAPLADRTVVPLPLRRRERAASRPESERRRREHRPPQRGPTGPVREGVRRGRRAFDVDARSGRAGPHAAAPAGQQGVHARCDRRVATRDRGARRRGARRDGRARHDRDRARPRIPAAVRRDLGDARDARGRQGPGGRVVVGDREDARSDHHRGGDLRRGRRRPEHERAARRGDRVEAREPRRRPADRLDPGRGGRRSPARRGSCATR